MKPITRALLGALFALCACDPSDTGLTQLVPEIAVAPAAVDYGDVGVLLSATDTVYISNGGRAPLDLNLSIEGEGFSTDLATVSVPEAETLELQISFAPTTYVDYAGTLLIDSNDAETPHIEVQLSGRGIDANLPDIDLDPASLDFEAVDAGATDVQVVSVHNRGTGPLSLGTLQQSGSGAFHILADVSGTTVGSGQAGNLVIEYRPTHDDGDEGSLVIPSDDPDEPSVTLQLLGNGGGDFDYPIADIDCPGVSAPPAWVPLDGSGSSDPGGNTPLVYLWSLVSQPAGSQGGLENTITEDTALYTDVAGDYLVELVVTNSVGIASAPARCPVQAIPEDDLHVELVWDTSRADIDLHLLKEGEFSGAVTLFEEPGDCTYCNPNPDWGTSSTQDDPRLDLDDRGGWGPENINVLHPQNDTYQVKVHYFEEKGDDVVAATVRVYTYGVLVDELSRQMQRNEVWDVGQVNWPDGTFGRSSADLWSATRRECF